MKNFIILITLFFSASIFSQLEINDDNSSSKLLNNNDKLIFVDFYATWCGPCKIMDPIIAELADEYGDKVSFYKMDVDKNSTDDALGVTAMPTYFFIKNSKTLEVKKGAMSKQELKKLIDKHLGLEKEEKKDYEKEFSKDKIAAIWNDYSKLNSLAWHAYEEHDDIKSIVTSIKLIKRSIELNENYYNLDTYASLLYKTGAYSEAITKANKAIKKAKEEGVSYTSTKELIKKIEKEM
jgi:thioredoxin 1